MTPEQIAAGLTKAQREEANRLWQNCAYCCRLIRPVVMRCGHCGCVDRTELQDGQIISMLGLAVRAALIERPTL